MTDTFTCAIEDAQRPGAKRCEKQCPSCDPDHATLTLRTQEEQAMEIEGKRLPGGGIGGNVVWYPPGHPEHVPNGRGSLSNQAQDLLWMIDRAQAIGKEISAFKLKLPTSGRPHCDKASDAMKALVSTLRGAVGERVVADHLGVEPERKF